MLSVQFLATRFMFDSHKVHVSLHNKEVGKCDEFLTLQNYTGPDMDIRFFAPYILSGMQVLQEEYTTFFLKNSSKPIMFESNLSRYQVIYLVMPVSPTA